MDDTVKQVLAILLFFAPYIMMFTIIKWAFSLNRTLGGMAGNISKIGQNFRGNQAKKRAGIRAENMAKMKAGNRFADNNPLSRGFNSVSRRAGTGIQGNFGFGKRGKEAVDQATRGQAAVLAKDPRWQGIQEDDDALMAATYGSASEAKAAMTARYQAKGDSAEVASQKATRAVNAVQSSVRFGKAQQVAAAQQLAATGTGYDNAQDMVSTIARASGGNRSTAAAIAGFNNAISKQKGRHDLTPGFGKLNGAINDQLDAQEAIRQGKTPPAPTVVGGDSLTQDAWNSGSMYQLANGKDAATKQFAAHHLKGLKSNNAEERKQAAIGLMEMQNMLSSATGSNQVIINKAIQDAGITFGSGVSIEDQLSGKVGGVISSADIRGMARVYDRDLDPRAAQERNIQQNQG